MKPGWPASTCASVLLPEPLGPITACTSPARTSRSMPRRISLPATPACNFPMLNMFGLRPVPDAALEAHAQEPGRLHRELHRQVPEDLLAEAVDDHRDCV